MGELLNGKENAMLQLFAVMLLLQTSPGPGVGQRVALERFRSPTPVSDKFLIPARPPDCRTAEEEQIALEQIRNGEIGQCMVREQPRANRR